MSGSRDREQRATRRFRLFPVRKPLQRSDSERINALAHDAHVPVEDVLREVADFRLALETDMIIAAAAVDAESPELLADVLDGERTELATFHDRLLGRLADAAASDELALRRERRRPPRSASKVVASAAAAIAVLSAGRVVTQQQQTRELRSNNVALATANEQYADLSSAVTSASPRAVAAAAHELHLTLQTLINEHAGDPGVAEQAAQLLQAEIALLEVRGPEGASQVLAQARTLVRMLNRNAPPQVRATVAPLLDAVSSPRSSPKPTTKPKPSASPTPTPKPKPATTSPKPTATSTTAQPSASPSDGPLHAPGAG